MNLRTRLIAIFWLTTGFLLPNAFSQGTSVVDKIVDAIRLADASGLAEEFNTTIDLLIPDNEGMYSNNQAEQVMKVFFKNNPVEKFTLDHQGNSNDGSKYIIGTYKTTGGLSFMVYVLIKKTGNQEQLYELRFEKE
jgi:hypothetical protein